MYVFLLGYSLFQEHASLEYDIQKSIYYNLSRRRLKRRLIFKIQIFICSNEEDVAKILLFISIGFVMCF